MKWHTGSDEDAHIVYDEECRFVADCGRDDGDADLESRHARLIAAAPALLEACEELAGLIRDGFHNQDIAVVRAVSAAIVALAKAKGAT